MENEQDNTTTSNSNSTNSGCGEQPDNTGRDLPARNPDVMRKSDIRSINPHSIEQRDEE